MNDGMITAYISLGSNIGDRLNNLQNALDSIKLLPDTFVVKVSPVFETKPVGYTQQDNFYNAASQIQTGLPARVFLGALLGVEAALGRVRLFKNGPRIVDIDLLLYGNESINDNHIIVPHPRMFEREFITATLLPILSDEKLKKLLRPVEEDIIRQVGLLKL